MAPRLLQPAPQPASSDKRSPSPGKRSWVTDSSTMKPPAACRCAAGTCNITAILIRSGRTTSGSGFEADQR